MAGTAPREMIGGGYGPYGKLFKLSASTLRVLDASRNFYAVGFNNVKSTTWLGGIAAATISYDLVGFYAAKDGWQLRRRNTPNGIRQVVERPTRYLRLAFNDRFFSTNNLLGVAKDASFIAIMAVAASGIIVMGGIDLSVGSVYALSAVLGAMVLTSLDPATSAWVAVPLGVGTCCLVGATCGALSGSGTVG